MAFVLNCSLQMIPLELLRNISPTLKLQPTKRYRLNQHSHQVLFILDPANLGSFTIIAT